MPKANSRRLDKAEKGVLVHLLQAPKLTNGDIAKIIDVDERTISRRRKQLRTLGHLSPERNVKGAEKLRPWHLEVCSVSSCLIRLRRLWSLADPDCRAACRESSLSSRRTMISSSRTSRSS